MVKFPINDARHLVRVALAEDIGRGDITTSVLIPDKLQSRAVLLAKADGVIVGLPILALVFGQLDRRVKIKLLAKDGDRCRRGQILAELHGPACALLTGERTTLNFIQRLSGIATLTKKFVGRVPSRGIKILDTRKTTPTFRALEKYAVACGGGTNHRFGLYDQILIKDNHLKILRKQIAHAKAQSSQREDLASLRLGVTQFAVSKNLIANAVAAARKAHPRVTIEIECQSLAEVAEAVESNTDIIMLDNMTPAEMKKAVLLIAGRAKTEASGGITLANIAAVAATGVDFISIGALTHSAPTLDLSLEMEE